MAHIKASEDGGRVNVPNLTLHLTVTRQRPRQWFAFWRLVQAVEYLRAIVVVRPGSNG